MEKIIEPLIKSVEKSDKISDEIKKIFKNAINNTFTTTIKLTDRDDAFVITGDIDAMRLRDSSGQIRPLFYLNSKESDELIKKVIKRQFFSIDKDYYANAFNEEANGRSRSDKDITDYDSPWVWERKYELDSLSYIMQTAYLYYEKTKDDSIFDKDFIRILENIIDQIKLEQDHKNSAYVFERPNPRAVSDSLREGKYGTPVGFTKMSRSGFRPSDDSCVYQYLIPANAQTVVALRGLSKALKDCEKESDLTIKMDELSDEIDQGIREFGIIDDNDYGKIFAYEVDGLGNTLFMDDANVPSLLSLPYLNYIDKDDPLYVSTRKAIFSDKNKNYYEGTAAKGIGSDHTPDEYIWHIALSIAMMTTDDKNEQKEILKYFENTHADKYLMHEGFHKDNPDEYTRDRFSRSNSMFVEAILRYIGVEMIKA